MGRTILVEQAIIRTLLKYAQMLHPREAILLLKGRTDNQQIVINDTQIPPLATHGTTFSTFPLHMLPIDFTIVGTAHSHPSGALHPSVTDLNKFYGKIMAIVAYPYLSKDNVAVFDPEGRAIKYEIIEARK